MTTYYVSSSGLDTNNGTSPSTPWLTLGKVNGFAFAAGDTCLFNGGNIWVGSATNGTQLQPSVSGTSGNPITFSSYGTGNAIIANSSITTNYNGVLIFNLSYITVQNLLFIGPYVMYNTTTSGINVFASTGTPTGVNITNCESLGWQNGIAIGSTTSGIGYHTVTVSGCTTNANSYCGIYSYNSGGGGDGSGWGNTNITVTGCTANGNLGNKSNTTAWTGSGIVLSNVNGGTITKCVASGNGLNSSYASGGPVGIWAFYSNNVTISNNIAYNNKTGTADDGDGFDLDIGCTNCTLEYNIAFGNYGAGILIDGDAAWTGNTVRYNITWGNHQNPTTGNYGELTLAGTLHTSSVYNNTFIANAAGGSNTNPCVYSAATNTGITVRNNIFYMAGTTNHVRTSATQASTALLFQGNNYSGATLSINWGGTTYTTMAAWQAAATNQEQNGATNYGTRAVATANPNFVTVGQSPTVWSDGNLFGAYGLQMTTSSTLLTAGLNLNSLFSTVVGTQDFFGNTLSATQWPIGASYTAGWQGSAPTLTTRLFKGSTAYARLTA